MLLKVNNEDARTALVDATAMPLLILLMTVNVFSTPYNLLIHYF